MKTARILSSVLLAACATVATLAAQAAAPTIALRGGTVHTLAGEPNAGATVIIENGLISAVGSNVTVPAGAQVIDATGLHVYPGMFDAITQLGLTEVGAVDVTNDTRELGDYNPHLLAMTAVYPASEHIPVARANGITHTVAAPGGGRGGGGVMAGQGSLLHLDGWTVEEMVIEPSVGIMLTFPTIQTRRFNFATFTTSESSFRDAQRQYEERVEELERWLESARHYAEAVEQGVDLERDLKLEAIARVTDREIPFLVSANAKRDINNALDFAERNNVRIVILGGSEAVEVADRLAEMDVPVILGPTQSLPRDEDGWYDEVYAAPGQLYAAGVKIAFGTFGASDSRTLPYEAGSAVPYGLPQEEALKAITVNPAEILGVGDRLGTIEPGKIANIIVTDGDPIETQTQMLHLIVNGRIASKDNKHLRLYERYRARPRRP